MPDRAPVSYIIPSMSGSDTRETTQAIALRVLDGIPKCWRDSDDAVSDFAGMINEMTNMAYVEFDCEEPPIGWDDALAELLRRAASGECDRA